MRTEMANPTIAMHKGLLYVSDQTPGFARIKSGKGFGYRLVNGKKLSDAKHIARIQQLAIPPAYTPALAN